MPEILLDNVKNSKASMLPANQTQDMHFGSYMSTPKYLSDHTDTRKMARFYIPNSLFAEVLKVFPKAQTDPIFNRLNSVKDKTYGGFYNFLLQNVSESHSENVQVVQTLSDNYITFSMGAKPPIFSYSGVLINSQEDDWNTEFFLLYSQYLRASKLAQFSNAGINNTSLLKYDNKYVRGSMITLSTSLQAQNELAVSFNFQFLVKDIFVFTQENTGDIDNSIFEETAVLTNSAVDSHIVNTDATNENVTSIALNKDAIEAYKSNVSANNSNQVVAADSYKEVQTSTKSPLDFNNLTTLVNILPTT